MLFFKPQTFSRALLACRKDGLHIGKTSFCDVVSKNKKEKGFGNEVPFVGKVTYFVRGVERAPATLNPTH